MDQRHLHYRDRVNLGGYYTKPCIVSLVYSLLKKNVEGLRGYTLLDTSCGYGSFLHSVALPCPRIGADIDGEAVRVASSRGSDVSFFCHNSLQNVSREQYGLSAADKVIVVGNPPYNDATSIIRQSIKRDAVGVDRDLLVRDVGISFLLSYGKLRADYVCVLHPLSYLIKRANFALLGKFAREYRLIDAIVISSGEFSETSRSMAFPIVVALYRRGVQAMDFPFVEDYSFPTKEGKEFKLSAFDYISRYITKYPNRKDVNPRDVVAQFWTMRDINALKRNRTFVQEATSNAVLVTSEKLDYYCYVDVFKRYAVHIPYYLGNCDVIIDNDAFTAIRPAFRLLSLRQHTHIPAGTVSGWDDDKSLKAVDTYMRGLLGEHYVRQRN